MKGYGGVDGRNYKKTRKLLFKHIYYFSELIMLKYLRAGIKNNIIHLYELQSHVICVQNFTPFYSYIEDTYRQITPSTVAVPKKKNLALITLRYLSRT
jgi:hypothetical protein